MPNTKPPLWKQLTGAVVGASLALVLYGGYKYGSTRLSAYITIPQLGIFSGSAEPVRTSSNVIPDDKLQRIALKAENVAKTYSRRIEVEDPVYDVLLDEELAKTYEAPSSQDVGWQNKVSDDWWNTQQDWASVEDDAQYSAPSPLLAGVVSSDMQYAPVAKQEPIVVKKEWVAPEPVYAKRTTAPDLPDSGIGFHLALIGSALGAFAMRRMRPAA